MRVNIGLILLVVSFLSQAQFTDDFSDGDFVNNPTWVGDDSEYAIDSEGVLRLNNLTPESNNESYLSIPSVAINNAVWEFSVGFDGLSSGGLSSSNKMFIFLTADRADLKDNAEGYYVLVGNTDDEISLYSTMSGEIIDGIDKSIEVRDTTVTVRVTRDDGGNWELLLQPQGDMTFSSLGTATNLDYTTSEFFGVLSDYTSTRSTNFFFDDFAVSGTGFIDDEPPSIASLSVISEDSLTITFSETVEKTTSETAANYTVSDGFGVPASALLLQDGLTVALKFTSQFTDQSQYTLTVDGVEDLFENAIDAGTATFTYFAPFVPNFRDIVINEIMPDPPGSTNGNVPTVEYVELFNASDESIDLTGWVLKGVTSSGRSISGFELDPREYLILTNDVNVIEFEGSNVISWGGTSSSALTNGGEAIVLEDKNGIYVDSLVYNGSTDGISIEQINPNIPFALSSNYDSSENPEGGTPGQQNSIFDDTPDTTAPSIVSITVVSANELAILFDEFLEKTAAELVANYSIESVDIFSATLDLQSQDLVQLTTAELPSGENKTLTVNNVKDLFGNATANESANIRYVEFDQPQEFDVVINEFLADPTPVIGLPDGEFVELYNRSEKFFDLADLMLDGSNLPTYTLEPESYVVIIDDNNISDFSGFDQLVTVPSLSLNNSGPDTIRLQGGSSELIHSIAFDGSTGGISTEVINPNGPDYSKRNYGLSTDPSGGTPGRQNSIFDDTPDTTPPSIVSISVISATELEVVFDELLGKASAELASNYSIQDIAILSANQDNDDGSLVHLLTSLLPSGEAKTLAVNNVEDLLGNKIISDSAGFRYVEFEEPQEFDVVINEFLADPTPVIGLPDGEFVELYNRSENFFNLADLMLDGSSLPAYTLEPDSYVIIIDDNNLSDFSGFDQVAPVSTLSLNNSGSDTILLEGVGNQLVHSIVFNGSSGGVSTELINPNGPDYSERNYGLSTDPSGGTPGRQNAIFDDTPDTTPPSLVFLEVIDSTELVISFDEPIIESSATLIDNYSIDGDVRVISAIFFEESKVQLSTSRLPSAEVRKLTVNSISDLSGNMVDGLTAEFEYIETALAENGDVQINEFLAFPAEQSNLPNVEYVELYNKSDKYIDLENWILADRSGDSRALASYILRPDSYLILADEGNASQFEPFGSVLEVSAFPSLNNGSDDIILRDSLGRTISFLTYNSSTEGISSELINPEAACISFASFSNSLDPLGGTPGQINSVFDDNPDTVLPFVMSFGYQEGLVINFSEVMDELSLSDELNYSSETLSVQEVLVLGTFPTSVVVVFSEEIVLGEQYDVVISGLQDCAENTLKTDTLSFGFGRSPVFNELIFTEVLFDEGPSVGLPEREYLEIFNTSDDIISTAGLALFDATNSVELPTVNLHPSTYYVLTSNAGAAEFETNAIGVSGFPSLNNSGELLVISLGDELISSLEYDPNWHSDEKATGGYSLELVDITNPCLESASNWRSSDDPKGGTPGMLNSFSEIIPDSFGPEIVNITAISADTIRIAFDEKIDPSSALKAFITAEPTIKIKSLLVETNSPKTLLVTLQEDLEANNLISLSAAKIFDCSGNEVVAEEFTFSLPIQAVPGEIKLSEVLFNPRSNGVDFVELYNDSDNYISLENWELARVTDEGIGDNKSIALNELVIEPSEYLVFTRNSNALFSNYPKGREEQFIELPSLPTYANDTGNVVLINSLGELMEKFFYDEDYHYDLLESVDGVSLERISFDSPTNQASNWRSASSTEGFATPGYANSQAFSTAAPLGKVEVSPKVFVPGNSGSGRDFTTINYQFDNPGQFANVNIYDQNGRLVRNLVQGELLATSGFLRWDGETNDGSMARLGYYVVLFEVYDAAGNSEILKETVAVGRDF